MSNTGETPDILKMLDEQHHVLRPLDTEDRQAVIAAYDAIRNRFAEIIREHGTVDSEESLETLCKSLNQAQRLVLSPKSEESAVQEFDRETVKGIRLAITKARQYTRQKVEREQGWKSSSQEDQMMAAIQATRKFLNVDPYEEEKKSVEEELEEIPEAVRNAYRYLVEELGLDPALLTHLLCLTHPEQFSWSTGTIDSIKGWVGKCEVRAEPAIPNLPPEILISPSLGWFRKIFFNELRDKYFPLYNQPGGLQKVHSALQEEIGAINQKEKEQLHGKRGERRQEILHEFAIKRRFINALIQYFEELENLPHPTRLKNSLGGSEPFPNRYQLAAIFETLLLGKYFNATEMGGGKTGYAIGFFEHMREQKDENDEPKAKKAVVLCPSGIVKVWQQRLSDSKQGYFRKGQAPKVAVINGSPQSRRKQWEDAKNADYVVIGIEMSRGGTEAVAHEEWIQALGADTLIIDEVHNAKNADGKESSDTERIYRISQNPSIKHRLLLSGTPIPNHRKDIAAQLRLLHADPEKQDEHVQPSIDVFETFIENAPISTEDARTIATQQPTVHSNGLGDINFHNLQHLTKMIEDCDTPVTQHYLLPYLYRIRTAECLPVDATLRPTIEDLYDLSPAERVRYKHSQENEETELLPKIHELHRTCLDRSKVERLEHWIDTFIEEEDHSGKIVAASPHYKKGVTKGDEAIVEALKQKYEKQGIPVFILDGDESGNQELKEKDKDGTPMTKTKRIIAAFRDHQGPAVLLTQMDVIREGIDLSFASRAIMLSPAWTRPEEDQFWRRFYRRGQEHDVQCVKLIAKNTIEEGLNILSLQKQQLGEQLLQGRKLTEDEMQLLDVGSGGAKANPYMWWALLSPKEKLNVLWGQMIHKGEEYVRKTMERFGSLFAELYNHDWETSYNGNTARLVAAVIDQLDASNQLPRTKKRTLDVADIASGAFAVERTLQDRDHLRIWSSDINPAMIGEEMGNNVLGAAYNQKHTDVAAMDNLPYTDESKELAVLSLGLHYAMHRDKPEFGGKERIRTLYEFNRILVQDGIGIITLPPSIFRGRMKQKFDEICTALRYFGFEIIPEMSNRAQAKQDSEEKKFETYVFTIRKVSEPLFDINDEWEHIPEQVRIGLDLSRKKKTGGQKGKNGRRRTRTTEKDEGKYHDEFILGNETFLQFEGSASQQNFKERTEEKLVLLEQSPEVVQVLLEEYQTFDEVPPEKWLSVPLDAIGQSPSRVQDVYAQALLTQETRALTKEFLESLNDGQENSSLTIRKHQGNPHLVLSTLGTSGKKRHRKYSLEEYEQS